jgi:hypothetical protein
VQRRRFASRRYEPRSREAQGKMVSRSAEFIVRFGRSLGVVPASDYVSAISMPTSLHIPKPLLAAVDRRARSLKMSRNRFIVQALEREVAGASRWSPGFFEKLAEAGPEDAEAVDEMLEAIRRGRTRKGAPRL